MTGKKIPSDFVDRIVQVFAEKANPSASVPSFDSVKRGFVEFVVDLGSEEPSETDIDALNALMAAECISNYVVLQKSTESGMYAYGICSVSQYIDVLRYNFEFDTNLIIKATSLENFPAYALNADGTRRHLFAGIGDPEEGVQQ